MNRLHESTHVSYPLTGAVINNSNETGRYTRPQKYRELCFVAYCSGLAADKTFKLELLEATDADGTGAQLITGASAQATSGTKAIKSTVALASAENTDVVTVNGVAFTMAAEDDTAAAEFEDADGLVDCIEASSIADEVDASASGTTVTLVAKDGYSITLAKTEEEGTITLADSETMVYVSLLPSERSDGYDYVAPKLTSTGNSVCSCLLLQGKPTGHVTQSAAASATL